MISVSEDQKFAIEVVGNVFPFRTNNYVVENLIDWDNAIKDPIFILNFPQKDMLLPHNYADMATLIRNGSDKKAVQRTAKKIRLQLNPHPAGQLDFNVPALNGGKLYGMQHKYGETILFFPAEGQACFANCSFCFRWPQLLDANDFRIATKDIDSLIRYIWKNRTITDVLITGGDPLVMTTSRLAYYVDRIIDAKLPNIKTIRIGTKALSYWPYRFLTDGDAEDLLRLFNRVVKSGRHMALMAHFNHPRELSTDTVKEAIKRIRDTGAQIRTQTPLLRHINDDPDVWVEMLTEQMRLGLIPYYIFVVRNTGPQQYYNVTLVRGWEIYRDMYKSVSGLARTIRGPSMSTFYGKIQVVGVSEINGRKVIVLKMIQGRDPEWVIKPFFAEYDEEAIWIDDLVPAFGEDKFFFEEQTEMSYQMACK